MHFSKSKFGSTARGEAGPASDVDLLVEMEQGRTLLDLVGFWQDVEELLGCRVDVITDGGISPQVFRGLTRMGATARQAEAYVDGLRHGGVLIFATDADQKKVDAAAEVMNKHGATKVEETSGAEPELPVETPDRGAPVGETQAGRIRQPEEGAQLFVW